MSEKPGVCIHGGLRRQCETCDLAERLEHAETQRDAYRRLLLIAHEILERNGIARPEMTHAVQDRDVPDRDLPSAAEVLGILKAAP